MQVIKRDGSKEEFDISKIRKVIDFACNGLDINPIQLEASLTKRFKNNTTTEDIQKELIIASSALASIEEPDWIDVSGRLIIYNLQRDIYKKYKIDYTTDFYDVITFMCKKKYYDSIILQKYTKEEISSLTKYIKPELDKDNTIGSAISLQNKYLIRNNKGVVELPQHANMTIALFLNMNENKEIRMKSVIEEYKLISEKVISLATPFKANLRIPGGNLSSCFIIEAEDNIESIMKCVKDTAVISKNGGGLGIYLGRIRPSNSLIRGIPAANNICSWVKIFNDTIVSCNQLGRRNGSATISIDIWHKDLLDFIKIKKEEDGDIRLKSFDIFPQVILNNIFISRVIDNKDWYLLDYTEIKRKLNIDITKVGELERTFDIIEKAVLNKKLENINIVSARDLWVEMLKTYIETGDLYLSHKDNINHSNPMLENNYEGHSLNLCLESYGPIKASSNFRTITNGKGEVNEIYDNGYYHCCNLSAINLSVILNDEKLLEKACRKTVRMLDKAIDLTSAPTTEANNYNNLFRNINVTDLGLADWMAYNRLSYLKEEDWDKVLALYEKIAYYTLDESCNLAQEKGSFELFNESNYTKGIMIGKTAEELTKNTKNSSLDWFKLSERVKQGVRNVTTRAICPNTSCQSGYNEIITDEGIMSVYDILTNREGLNYEEIEKKAPHWIELKNPINIPTHDGKDIIERIWWNGFKKYVEIEFEDGNKYRFTLNHKLLVLTKYGYPEWIECKDLKEYDEVVNSKSSYMKIVKINKRDREIATYDVEAKKYHHYLLSNGCASHNTSVVIGSSASYLPIFNKFSYESMNKMNVPIAPKFIKTRFWNYNEAFTIPTEKIIKLTTAIQYYIDNSISMELVINPDITDIRKISNSIIDGFQNGLKAVYYSRTIQISSDGSKSIVG